MFGDGSCAQCMDPSWAHTFVCSCRRVAVVGAVWPSEVLLPLPHAGARIDASVDVFAFGVVM